MKQKIDVIANIRAIRQEKGISQEFIADALHIDNSAVSNIEKGKRELKVKELQPIADALGVDVLFLFTYPHHYVDITTLEVVENKKVCVSFEVSPKKRDYLLRLVMENEE